MPEISGPLQGKLLVAAPGLLDPNFARSVVFVLAHSDQGAVGLVLNRPTMTLVGAPLPEWDDLASVPAVVFVGGPVSEGSICLARVKPQVSVPETGYLPLDGSLGTVDLEADPAFVSPWVEKLRVFAGYGGWGPGQLEGEIAQAAWYVVDAVDDDVFSEDPAGLWKNVLRRQNGSLALVSAFPSDPSLN
ncbi:MAG TPA: YqgE/AlgH family protein [Acidimicrobiales bacterium]|nr:YqgE/AlgH family protein [Acidimicrobiales bacterium]